MLSCQCRGCPLCCRVNAEAVHCVVVSMQRLSIVLSCQCRGCPLCRRVNAEAVHCVVVSMQRLSDVMHLDMIMDKSAEEIMKVRMCVCA